MSTGERMRYVLSVDAGTTSVRCLAFGPGCELLAEDQLDFPQHCPSDGLVEQDPMDILDVAVRCIRSCVSRLGKDGCVALSIANQRETTVVWDRYTGKPVYPAIVWQDRRTATECERMKDCEPRVHHVTGLRMDAYFSATKIAWILDHVEGARGRAERGELLFGNVDSWLVWNLTSGREHRTDTTNASRTMLFDIERLEWSDEMLDLFRVPRCILPEVLPSDAVFGVTDEGLIGVSVPITGVIGDQQSALFGQSCLEDGDIKVTFGTGGFLLMNIGQSPERSDDGLVTTVAWSLGGRTSYAIEGSVYIAGEAVQWIRDDLGLISESAETEGLATSVPDTAGCYLVPAFVGLGAPYWDQEARGTLVGLSRRVDRRHIARAVLESMAYQTYDVLRCMEPCCPERIRSIKVDGGASANGFLCQFLADITGTEVVRPSCIEATAMGCARIAGVAVGLWEPDTRSVTRSDVFVPRMDEDRRRALLEGWRRAVGTARHWSSDRMG
ncbi:MAG: glycerol kinase GlpK [Candidatus Methanomethylophilaceae archaeon]|nr:glycerol kinase GlpK [Candidatus Methanomethylophilaceae archaeon]